jgi:hypothetical protein
MKTITLVDLEKIIQNSAFNKQAYIVNIPVRRFIKSLMAYVDDTIEEPTYQDILENAIPNFQRNNDKWTRDMQIKFVENVIKGFVTKIQLFELKNEGVIETCKILDGFQRVTALSLFIEGEYKIFNNSISFNDVKDTFLRGLSKTIIIEVFNFDSLNEVIDFYVEMNENITHSPEDIQKALSFKI